MTIEIVGEVRVLGPGRAVDFIISSGGQSYFYQVGQLPFEGDLQAILDGMEADLWPKAQANGQAINLYSQVDLKRLVKAIALVNLDEINILRQRAGLALRTPGQVDDAVKVKLKGM